MRWRMRTIPAGSQTGLSQGMRRLPRASLLLCVPPLGSCRSMWWPGHLSRPRCGLELGPAMAPLARVQAVHAPTPALPTLEYHRVPTPSTCLDPGGCDGAMGSIDHRGGGGGGVGAGAPVPG